MTGAQIKQRSDNRKSWRGVLAIHPAAAAYPRPSAKALEELAADIKANGLRVNVVVLLEDGKPWLLDGISRLDALEAAGFNLVDDNGEFNAFLGIGVRRLVDFAIDVDDPYAYAASLNAHRRHLTPEQKRERIEALIKAGPQKSDRAIAQEAKINHKIVGRTRRRLEATGTVSQSVKRIGADGKARRQPAIAMPPGGGHATQIITVPTKLAPPRLYQKPITVKVERNIQQRDVAEAKRLEQEVAKLREQEGALEIQLQGMASEIKELRDGRQPVLVTTGKSKNTLHCSFCGKNQHEVITLVAGRQAFICNECVARCADIVRKTQQAKSEPEKSEPAAVSTAAVDDDIPPFLDRSAKKKPSPNPVSAQLGEDFATLVDPRKLN